MIPSIQQISMQCSSHQPLNGNLTTCQLPEDEVAVVLLVGPHIRDKRTSSSFHDCPVFTGSLAQLKKRQAQNKNRELIPCLQLDTSSAALTQQQERLLLHLNPGGALPVTWQAAHRGNKIALARRKAAHDDNRDMMTTEYWGPTAG